MPPGPSPRASTSPTRIRSTRPIGSSKRRSGLTAPPGQAVFLGERRQPGGKRVSVWALEGDLDVTHSSSNTFEIEWPRGSGTIREFPEVDRVEWVSVDQARRKLVKGQTPFLDALLGAIASVAGRNDRGSTTPGSD